MGLLHQAAVFRRLVCLSVSLTLYVHFELVCGGVAAEMSADHFRQRPIKNAGLGLDNKTNPDK
jgi:hypothetical protein